MKICAIIQARMGSTRLPGKVLMSLNKKSVLEQVVSRVKKSSCVNQIIIATTNLDEDNLIVEEANKIGVLSYRGSSEDVLSRYYGAAKENQVDVIVRITSDCPLIDPDLIDAVIKKYLEGDYDIVTNAPAEITKRTFPRGLDTEVFSFNALETAYCEATEAYTREHVTPYIYEKSNKIGYVLNDIDLSDHRWTLDTPEDFELIEHIYKELSALSLEINTNNTLNFLEKNPEIKMINEHVAQKSIK